MNGYTYVGPWSNDLPMVTYEKGGLTPPHFSKGKAMVFINESSMRETAGLTGDSQPYVFQNIKKVWAGLSSYAAEVRENWVDWNRNSFPNTTNVANPQPIRPNVAMMMTFESQGVNGDMDDDGIGNNINVNSNCYYSSHTGKWTNASTGLGFTSQAAACLDGANSEMPGTYTVAMTSGLCVNDIYLGIQNQRIAPKTYNNETDYLKELDMHLFGFGCEGMWQYRALVVRPRASSR